MRLKLRNSIRFQLKKRFSTLEDLEDNGNIYKPWDAIRQSINISAKRCIAQCEGKRHKPWFDEECSKSVHRRKQAKPQWLLDPSLGNEDNLSNVRREARKHFRNKKREYSEDKINKLGSQSKNRKHQRPV
jgi:hypothetical protein